MPEVQNLIDVNSPEFQGRIKTSLQNLATDLSKAVGNGTPVSQTQLFTYLEAIKELLPQPGQEFKRTLSDEIREWITTSTGTFESSHVVRDMQLSSRSDRKNLSKILERLAKENIITKIGEKRGQYRVVDQTMQPMSWRDCDITKTYELKMPLGFHNIMYVYPKNILVIAGDTNAGKTAYLLNLVRDNADNLEIDYFTNDLTPEELKKRVSRFEEAGMNTDAFDKCQFIPRSRNFIDIIHPDRLTIIDYLQLTDKFWLVAEEINNIYEKLGKGIAFIAIQKKKGVKMGRGGDFAAEQARLYFTMEKGKIVMEKMKNLIDPLKDPNGKYVKFNLWAGTKFVPKSGWQGGSQPDPEAGQGENDASLPF